ncbi:zinc finger protein 280A [Hippopotamus amphibius kiboko]|uniref:zinc finger protein 280A n=1 Tax=Hippopotamus amphibius kiboko TaxID=575201 RepID=UPI002592565A|nr:zinc finger protein 280A [Hippopotamus amphibius kiboko]
MAPVFLCEGSQTPEGPEKKMGGSKPREEDEDNAEVIFVGVEHVSEDAETLFVRVISNSKPVISNILNRVTRDSSSKRKKGRVSQDPTCTLQPASRRTLASKAVATSSASPSEQGEIDSPVIFEPQSKPDYETSSLQVVLHSSSDLLSPWPHCLPGAALLVGGKDESPRASKRHPASDVSIDSGNPKRSKLSDGIPGGHASAVASPGVPPTKNMSMTLEGVPTSSSHVRNGASFPWTYANNQEHSNLTDPDRACSLERLAKTDFSSLASQNKTVNPKKGNAVMLLDDFYCGQHSGDGQPERKTHAAFKCLSCLKVLKNVKFMTHVRNHLELEKQKDDSWEIHTTCRHCHRQFPTPFQLQCHIESVHTSQEPSTVCKICELSFETDQVLLQHMKDNHKPGEMPYVCQVCSYRSSVFADVEAHFRTWHEHTNNLLCLFCLKIFKVATSYVNHAWRHWNKRVFQCSKCRLQFLTLKEKTEHQTKNHQPFKKPELLEGLPPETEVTIRTSVQPGPRQVASITVSNTDSQVSPEKTTKRMARNTNYSRLIAARVLAKNYVLPTSRNSKNPN